MTQQTAFVGTYTDGESQGIYTYEISPGEGPAIRNCGSTTVPENPTFLAVHPDQRHLYAVHEVEDGGVTALRIGSERHQLSKVNRVASGSGGPCHCHVHPSGDYLLVAHYTGGAVSVLPIQDDGSLGSPADVRQHEGSSEHPERQTQAHPHSITPGPNGQFLYVPDLGTDEIVVYELETQNDEFRRVTSIGVQSGAGPRHLDFHPNGEYVYVLNELDSTLSAFERNPDTGDLREIGIQPTVPAEFEGTSFAADVHVHPSGEWVFCSNRGHDSIAVFEIDARTGATTVQNHESTRGEWPRNFALDATGQLLFVENRDTDEIVAFRFDERTGGLDATGDTVDVPDPVCMQFLPSTE